MDLSALTRTVNPTSLQAAMDAALVAARRGIRGANPLVGATVVAADGTIVTGHHRGAGTPHAEVDALRAAHSAGIDLASAIVCVTLEPCSHHGRTGPCTDLLLNAKVPHVVIAVTDPNPAAAGGVARLRAAGVTVTTGVRESEAKHLNARWLRSVGERRPYVTLKIAQSIDGRIAAADGTSQWITSPVSRARVHQLRAQVDAVLVGTGTAHADNPRLTARPSPEATTSPEAAAGAEATADTEATAPDAATNAAGPVRVVQPIPVVIGMRDLDPRSHLAHDPRTVHLRTRDPVAALQSLRAQGIQHVLVEGGAQLAGALIRADLVDELELHIAPILLGDGLPGLADLGVTTLSEAVRWVPDIATGGTSTEDIPAEHNPDTILRFVPATAAAVSTATGSPTPDYTKDS